MIGLTRPACPNPVALQTDYRHPDNKAALRTASADKCMYCESRVTQVYYGDVEHIKPKSKFPQLEFAWENLGYVCAICNGAKGNAWCDETPFINPYAEDPSDHLAAVGLMVFHRGGSERGEFTEMELELNRPALIERRGERLALLRYLHDKATRTENAALRQRALAELDRQLRDDCEYAMVCRAALERLVMCVGGASAD